MLRYRDVFIAALLAVLVIVTGETRAAAGSGDGARQLVGGMDKLIDQLKSKAKTPTS